MAKARECAEWNRASQILAMLVNSNPWRKGEPAQPTDFHPYARRQREGDGSGGLSLKDVKGLFVKPT